MAGTREAEQQVTDAEGGKITYLVIKGYFTQDTNSLLASKLKLQWAKPHCRGKSKKCHEKGGGAREASQGETRMWKRES